MAGWPESDLPEKRALAALKDAIGWPLIGGTADILYSV
jgi:hypothetical protein